jgi:hypothetical protein
MYVRRRQYYERLRNSYGLIKWDLLLLFVTVDCGNGYNCEDKLLERLFVSIFTPHNNHRNSSMIGRKIYLKDNHEIDCHSRSANARCMHNKESMIYITRVKIFATITNSRNFWLLNFAAY